MRKTIFAFGMTAAFVALSAGPASSASFDSVQTDDAVIRLAHVGDGVPTLGPATFAIHAKDPSQAANDDAEGTITYDLLDGSGAKTGVGATADVICVAAEDSGSSRNATVWGWLDQPAGPATAVAVTVSDLDKDGVYERATAGEVAGAPSREAISTACAHSSATGTALINGSVAVVDGVSPAP
jgi:hypothetical protein